MSNIGIVSTKSRKIVVRPIDDYSMFIKSWMDNKIQVLGTSEAVYIGGDESHVSYVIWKDMEENYFASYLSISQLELVSNGNRVDRVEMEISEHFNYIN